jgi:uncharacterized PurR-regulated membrane protein YhhQ (DUF165 family)
VTLIIAILIYAVSMTLANLTVAAFGPVVTPVNGFVMIGLDLTLRDWLHVRLRPWQLGILIVVAGILTYALDHSTRNIAMANTTAFTLAALVDWAVFSSIRSDSWRFRANTSNVAGSAVDSLVFPTLAFGAFLPQVVLLQFLAKTGGGAFWTWLLSRQRAIQAQ